MVKRLFGKKGPSGLFSISSRVLLLPVTLLIGIGQVQAQTTSCFRSRDLTPSSNWTMAPSGSVFKNGDIVGRTSAYAQFYMPTAHGDTVHVDANSSVVDGLYGAIPLSGMPGLGLVVRWSGYSATNTLTPIAPGAASGTIISNKTWLSLLRARTSANYTLTQYYNFELVIIDEKIYKGGQLSFTDGQRIIVQTANKKGNAIPQVCINGFIDPVAALTGTVQVPELPKPVLPTCKFSYSTLNQRVPLGPVDPGQVVPYGSARQAGAEGQAHFLLEATGCAKGAAMNIYFTDARDGSTPKNYLLSTNPAVGVRLFHRGEYDPLPFGPAPSGSWVPPRYAPAMGPATVDGGALSTGFTVQYVRLPQKTEADVRPGPLEASAVLVIVYP